MPRFLALAALAFGLGVSAQTTGLSSQCTTGLAQIATNSTSACLSPTSLISLFTASSNTSIVQPINTWLSSVCGVPACSNATLAAVVTNLTAACSAELSSFGFTSENTATLISTVQEAYPTVRNVMCLEDGSTNCGLIATGNVSLPSNVTCTNCTQAAFNTVNTGFPGLFGSENSTLQQQCGSSFTDGSTPSGIVESASNSTASSSTGSNSALGAVSLISKNTLFGISASVLFIIGSAFAML
ncbi:hypothetical protein BT96DRAFT_1028684 [Gymnopus androsaceus JB14]|uniref:Uncharacterized protein n=1 Tax=Gymnopus androsaceus JB14 TaxID=1447944 RepID=A0A6A4ILN9_9AGAR|nr:hypothetical protein BT96DRAFT_1028684 [Gymnopus androsaceus JB14]